MMLPFGLLFLLNMQHVLFVLMTLCFRYTVIPPASHCT
jgi:hypothetical protein